MIKKKQKKVFVVGGSDIYAAWLERINYEISKDHTNIDLAIFTGGEDIYPIYYSEKIGKNTFYNERRDSNESDYYHYFKNRSIPMLGICRGAQFLTVMNKAKLIQHVTNHGIGEVHKIKDVSTEQEYDITSTHHQMMYPYNMNNKDYTLIAYSNPNRSNTYLNGNNDEIDLPEGFLEPEIVYYDKSRSLCIQGHPEYMDYDKYKDTLDYLYNLINFYSE